MDERAMTAVRSAVALTRAEHVVALRVTGDDAWETANALCSGDILLRDGQARHTLWLDERARPLADVYVLRDDDAFVFLAESRGPSLAEHARAHVRPGSKLEELSLGHRVVSLNGPFAWELLGSVVGPEVVGLPYLSGFHAFGGWVLRAGKTGEFGYDLVVPLAEADALEARLLDAGKRFGLTPAELDVLDQCALENWFFNVRREGRLDVTPLELQLQWRASRTKDYVGSAALAAHRAAGPKRRLVMGVAPSVVPVGAEVQLFGEPVGVVANAGASPLRGGAVVLALVDARWAHPGIADFTVVAEGARTPLATVTPPLPNNLSLHLDLQRHSWDTRDEISSPPLFDR